MLFFVEQNKLFPFDSTTRLHFIDRFFSGFLVLFSNADSILCFVFIKNSKYSIHQRSDLNEQIEYTPLRRALKKKMSHQGKNQGDCINVDITFYNTSTYISNYLSCNNKS